MSVARVMSVVSVVVFWIGVARADDPLPVRIDALMEARRFAEARPLIEQWCAELSGRPGPETALAEARARHVLGSVQDRLGEHSLAVTTFEQSLSLYAQAGAGPIERAAALDEAGRAAQAAGRFTEAERWLREAATARAGEPALAAASRSQLADVLVKSGRLDEAAAELLMADAEAGTDPAARWQVSRQRGVLAQTIGQYTEALGFYDQAIASVARLGDEGAALRASLDGQRGQVLFRLGRGAEAARALETAADFFRSRPDDSDEWLAQENNLAAVRLAGGQAILARERLRALLASASAHALGDSPALITPWLNARSAEWATGERTRAADALDHAERLVEHSLPKDHPLRIQVAAARMAVASQAGDRVRTRTEAKRASQLARAWLSRLGESADDSQWLDFRRTVDPISPLAVVGSEETDSLADAVFAIQGLGLERLLIANPKIPVVAPATKPEWREVTRSLPPGAALVNFVWWRPLLPDGSWASYGHYGALVFRSSLDPVWLDLGPAAEIDARIRRLIHAARDTVGANRAVNSRASLYFQAAQLWELAWSRVAPLVDGAESLLLRPDGMLHFVPWAIVRDPEAPDGDAPGQFFCQRYPRVKVLARAAAMSRSSSSDSALDWRVAAISTAPGRGAPGPPADGSTEPSPEVWREILAMPDLPGVVRETEAIRAAAPATHPPVTLPAREAGFPGAGRPPAFLHFSGHGFASDQPDEWGVLRLEAGLVFADCADGLRARAAGRPLPPDRDGILFARDAARLNLAGTELVTLSACQTGLGHWQPGEHLAGLRHAFILAGARHVASTLWDVNDAEAPALIEAFYRRLAAGVAPDEALWAAQRDWLESAAGDPAVRAALCGSWTLEAAGW